MEYDYLFRQILYLAAELIGYGSESKATLARIRLLCLEYGYYEVDFVIGSSHIVGSAMSPEGNLVSAMKAIEFGDNNYGKLSDLDNLYYQVTLELPDGKELNRCINEIKGKSYINKFEVYFAGFLGGTNFAIMLGATLQDLLISSITSLLVVFLGSFIERYVKNTFIYNAFVSLVAEYFIIAAFRLDLCQHPDKITIGVTMMLIGGLGIANGIWYLITNELCMGFHQINRSLFGALGLAIGICFPLLTVNAQALGTISVHSNLLIQLLSCTLGCVGFAIGFSCEKKLIPFVAVGACITWLVYSLVYYLRPVIFTAVLAAAVVESMYAVLVSFKMNKSPIIILTVSLLPLIPGANLFYSLYGFVTKDYSMMVDQLVELFTTCIAIVSGLGITEIALRVHLKEGMKTYVDKRKQ